MNENQQQPLDADRTASERPAADRPAYEPPRILKKRSVSRVTLFTGGGPPAAGLPAHG